VFFTGLLSFSSLILAPMGYGSGITLVIAVLFIIIDTQLVIKDAENDNFDVFQHARMLTLGIKIN